MEASQTIVEKMPAGQVAPVATPGGVRARSHEPVWIEAVDTVHALGRYVAEWQSLAANAAEPNVFYEPDLLLPALQAFGEGKDSLFLFVFHRDGHKGRVPIGFFPFERHASYRGWPANVLAAWQHPHAFLNTPLLDARFARLAWQAVGDWVRTDPRGASLVEFPIALAEGASHRALIDALHRENWLSYTAEQYTRAALLPTMPDGKAYVEAALSAGKRKELKRQRRRLADLGELQVRSLASDGDVELWIDRFLELEAAGWKGEARSALLRNQVEANYFRNVCRSLFARGRLTLLGLFVDDAPVAMKCNYHSGCGSFAVKIAYDESYAKFSPGVLLELENVIDAHARGNVTWMDSCAIPRHPMIDWLWMERRSIQHILISPGSIRGNFLLALFGLLRAFKRSFAKTKNPGESHVNNDERDDASR